VELHQSRAPELVGPERHVGGTYIEITVFELSRVANQSRPLPHRGRDAYQSRIGCGHIADSIAEDLGVGCLAGSFRQDADPRVESSDPVIEDWDQPLQGRTHGPFA